MGASAVVFHEVIDPGCLEAMECREALALAADVLVRKLTVASDCVDVVKGHQTKPRPSK
jgi:hypothetical protein